MESQPTEQPTTVGASWRQEMIDAGLALGLGLEMATLVADLPRPPSAAALQSRAAPTPLGDVDDAEWAAIARHLPAQAPQAGTMANRTFFNHVLRAVGHGRGWTRLAGAAPRDGERVRRRFARWAHAGVWQVLPAALATAPLSELRKHQLKALATRAEALQAALASARGGL